MAWTPVLLVFLSHGTIRDRPQGHKTALQLVSAPLSHMSVFAGHLSQPVLTQLHSISASLEATDRLACTLSSGFNVGGYCIIRYEQKPGSSSWSLLCYESNSDKHQGSGRFSGSKDDSANAGLLLISGLQAEDEADHYCLIWDERENRASKEYTDGSGKSPSVNPHRVWE
uniref:Immunoglobulin V-set domain-containing protein n=1 Tax=Ursus americanus TaxID=9643 RepID=A0A452QHL4_URSAM